MGITVRYNKKVKIKRSELALRKRYRKLKNNVNKESDESELSEKESESESVKKNVSKKRAPRPRWIGYDDKLLLKVTKYKKNGDNHRKLSDFKKILSKFNKKAKVKRSSADGLRQRFEKLVEQRKTQKIAKNEESDDDSEESEESEDVSVKYRNHKKRFHHNEQFEISESDEEDDDIEIVQTLKGNIQKKIIETQKKKKRIA